MNRTFLSIFSGLVLIAGAASFIYYLVSPQLNYLAMGNAALGSPVTIPEQSCPPMEAPQGKVIPVSREQIDMLQSIIELLNPGDTLLFQDGHYPLDGVSLKIDTPGVTLRSASGNPAKVVLDGNYLTPQIITIAASDVTLAELTLTRAFTHPLHIVSSERGNTENTLVYRVDIIDPREQAIKINPAQPGRYVDNGRIACSSLKLTYAGRDKVNPNLGCYTGGIDAHQARGWHIHDNLISGFWCPNGLSQHAINFWTGSRDTLIERNILLNNARAVGLGLREQGEARIYPDSVCPAAELAGVYIGHYGGMIKNNFIHASSPGLFNSSDGFDCGICLWSACNATVIHNTVVSTESNYSSIEWRFPGSVGTRIYNNLTSHPMRGRDGAAADMLGNLENASSGWFKDGLNGDIHIKPTAVSVIDQGVPLVPELITLDFDKQIRVSAPDIGADELSPGPSSGAGIEQSGGIDKQ
jgi:hypothetical protein